MNVHQTEQTLTRLRYLTMYDQSPLARMFRELDAHLSAGGQPPEAWREGPDAPGDIPGEVWCPTHGYVPEQDAGGCRLCDEGGYWIVVGPAGEQLGGPFLTEQDAEDTAEAMREPGDTEDALSIAYVNVA